MKVSTANIKMRRAFADALLDQMRNDSRIWVVTGDLGYKMWDQIQKEFPERYINVGAAEQSMIGIAVGLALEGKIPVAFSISTFLLYRPFETIRNYLNHEKIPVKLIGGGRDKDYNHDGITHWVDEDREIMKIFKNIKSIWPDDGDDMIALVQEMINDPNPWYINLKR